jgi:hypothetical protein
MTTPSWWEEDTMAPPLRKRDEWMKRIVGRVDKFQPTVPKNILPILVVDRHIAEDFTMVEQLHIPKGEGGTGGENIYVNALAHAIKAKQHRKQSQMETIARDLQEALKRKRKEEERAAEEERQRLRRLNHGVLVGEREEEEELGGMGLVPLELLPVNHPSHGSFRGLHPMFGRAEVRGFLPETPSSFITRGPFLGNILPAPASPFQDADEVQWQRNATPLYRDTLGALPTRGTFTARHDGKRRRQRYSQILLETSDAGNALFHTCSSTNRTRSPDNRQLLSRAGSATILRQQDDTNSNLVGIYDSNSGQQLVPAPHYVQQPVSKRWKESVSNSKSPSRRQTKRNDGRHHDGFDDDGFVPEVKSDNKQLAEDLMFLKKIYNSL